MRRHTRQAISRAVLVLLAVGCATAGWPTTSRLPVGTLDHPSIEDKIAELDGIADYTFYVFGDQRALADGEWQELMAHVGRLSAEDPRSLFMIDTGDIVESGAHADQFHRLADILSPAASLPYLVGVGNHEKSDNKKVEALRNAAAFLGYLDADFSPDRMYYSKIIGPVRYLFLDSNDFVYGDAGGRKAARVDPGSRAEAQVEWLLAELASDPGPSVHTTVAVMHHPIVQSSDKHSAVAATMWNLELGGRILPEVLATAGVDLILTGHTHTYERFDLTSPAGERLTLVNVSGRPRNSFLWIGAGARRANGIDGGEREWLQARGWVIPEGWVIEQRDHLAGEESNNFGIFTVNAHGGIELRMAYLDEVASDGLRIEAPVRID